MDSNRWKKKRKTLDNVPISNQLGFVYVVKKAFDRKNCKSSTAPTVLCDVERNKVLTV